MTDEELETAYQDVIDEYVGFEVDWDDPPGPASIALERMINNYDVESANIASESIDDLSVSYVTDKAFDATTISMLNTIRQLKW